MNEKVIRLYSYTKVWKIERKIYSFQNITLPVPINPYEVLYFIVVALVVLVLCRIMPFLEHIPVMVRYLLIPYGTTRYLLKKKLDGKNPVKYFIGCIVYVFSKKGKEIEGFKERVNRQEKITLDWNCSMGKRI